MPSYFRPIPCKPSTILYFKLIYIDIGKRTLSILSWVGDSDSDFLLFWYRNHILPSYVRSVPRQPSAILHFKLIFIGIGKRELSSLSWVADSDFNFLLFGYRNQTLSSYFCPVPRKPIAILHFKPIQLKVEIEHYQVYLE